MTSSPYYEPLPCGGMLVVKPEEWYIQYSYLTHPAAGIQVLLIRSDQIDRHLLALRQNLDIYLYEMKSNKGIPGAVRALPGAMHMTINLTPPHQGVCLKDCYRPVCSEKQFTKIQSSYRYAQQRAAEVQADLHGKTKS